MKNILLCLLVIGSFTYSLSAQDTLSRKEKRLEKRKLKFETTTEALAGGQGTFNVRKVVSSSVPRIHFRGGNIILHGDKLELDEFSWYELSGKLKILYSEVNVHDYRTEPNEDGTQMTAHFKGVLRGTTFQFKLSLDIDEKPQLWMKSSNGVEVVYIGVFRARS